MSAYKRGMIGEENYLEIIGSLLDDFGRHGKW
jgi:hypothetical protein